MEMALSNDTNCEAVVKFFPLPGDTGALGRIFLFGKQDAKHVVLFCAGFPDDCESSFVPLARQLSMISAGDEMLCGVTCLPGFDYFLGSLDDHKYKASGYTFEEVITSLREASKILQAHSSNPSADYIGIFHDWGCFTGSIFANREDEALRVLYNNGSECKVTKKSYFDKLVYIDILPPPHKDHGVGREVTIRKTVMEVSYRVVLAASFAIRRFVNKTLAAICFGTMFGLLNILRLSPRSPYDDETLAQRQKNKSFTTDRLLYMSYPYYHLLAQQLKSSISGIYNEFTLPKDLHVTPVLYMYGISKTLQFHDKPWLQFVLDQIKSGMAKSKVVPVDHAGHWFYLQHPELTLNEVRKFICDA